MRATGPAQPVTDTGRVVVESRIHPRRVTRGKPGCRLAGRCRADRRSSTNYRLPATFRVLFLTHAKSLPGGLRIDVSDASGAMIDSRFQPRQPTQLQV